MPRMIHGENMSMKMVKRMVAQRMVKLWHRRGSDGTPNFFEPIRYFENTIIFIFLHICRIACHVSSNLQLGASLTALILGRYEQLAVQIIHRIHSKLSPKDTVFVTVAEFLSCPWVEFGRVSQGAARWALVLLRS